MEKFYPLTEEQKEKVVAGRKESASHHLRLCKEPTRVGKSVNKKEGFSHPLHPALLTS